ncbi:FadR/GntR family transcriptional regulator [Martelella mangrovi]|uniref:DNA-binding FadR family transcriptional regulator n=1 Tax=Martelella mangrovi TaxID=1397477 RepID=A0ABV2IAD5_9HYPH
MLDDASASPRSKPRVHRRTVTRLAFPILKGEYPAGHVLPPEAELCENLGVSRSALREAIRTLKDKGMIEARPRHGTVVLPRSAWHMLDSDLLAWAMEIDPGPDFVLSLIEARQVIEPAAARLAAIRANPDDLKRLDSAFAEMSEARAEGDFERFNKADIHYHVVLLQASANIVFMHLSNMIGTALSIAFRMSMEGAREPGASLAVHGDVIECIRARDPDGAHAAMVRLLAIAVIDLGLTSYETVKS